MHPLVQVRVGTLGGAQMHTASLNQLRLVAAAKNMAKELMPVIQTNGVSALKPGHTRNEVRIRGFEDQVIIVAHEAVSMDLPIGFLASLGQGLDIKSCRSTSSRKIASRRSPRLMT